MQPRETKWLTSVSHMNIVSGEGHWFHSSQFEPIIRLYFQILTNQKTGSITFLNWSFVAGGEEVEYF